MSLSSLPTELVRQIIESSVPSTFHSTTYKERQSTLRSLCLVSRLFRHLAQPLLSEIVWIKSHEKLAIILEWMESKGWSDIPRSVALDDSTETWIKASDVEKLARSCQRLRELALNLEYSDKIDAFDLNVLQSFSRKLSIGSVFDAEAADKRYFYRSYASSSIRRLHNLFPVRSSRP